MITVKTYTTETWSAIKDREHVGTVRRYKAMDEAIKACFEGAAVRSAKFDGNKLVVIYTSPKSGQSYAAEMQITGDDLPAAARWIEAMENTHFFMSPDDIKKMTPFSIVACYHSNKRLDGRAVQARQPAVFKDPVDLLGTIKALEVVDIVATKYLINVYFRNRTADTVDKLVICKNPDDQHFVNLLMAVGLKAQPLNYIEQVNVK